MATITTSATGVTRIDAVTGRQGNDAFTIAGDTTTALVVDQDSRYGLNATPLSGGMSSVTPSGTVGGSFFMDGRYVRVIPYSSGSGSVPPPGVTITQGSASGKLIGVWSALNVGAESVGAAMPSSGYIKIKEWNEVPFTATTITIPSTTGANLIPANVSGNEGLLAASDWAITAGAGALTNSVTFAQTGTKSLRIAPSSTTTIVTKMANGTRFMIGAGLAVTVSAYIRGSDVKSCTVEIEWFDSTNASISTTTIQTQNCSSSAFTQYTAGAVTAPANTKWASVNITVTTPTSGGFYYVDNITATPGNWTTSATASAADRAGWIEVVGVEDALHVFSSANQTYQSDKSMAKGSWFVLGTTDGNRATTYQLPTNGAAAYHGGVLVDKAAATNISAASWSGGVASFTSTSHGLTTGDRVFIDGVLPRAYTSDMNNIQQVTVTGANTFTIPMTSNPGTYTSGGTVAGVEWYPTTTSLNTTIRTERVPGSVCWVDPATGLLRFGNDNITSTGGWCPVTGLKVRIPNIITSGVASGYATPLTNTLNIAVSSRVRWYGGNAGTCVSSQMAGSWSPSVFQTGKYVQLYDSCFIGQISIASQSSPSLVTFCCVGGNGTTTASTALVTSTLSSAAGVTITDNTLCVGEIGASSRIGISASSVISLGGSGNKIIGTGDRANTSTYAFNFNIGQVATFTNTTIVNCGGVVTSSQYASFSLTGTRYWGSGAGGVPVANAQAMFVVGNLSTNWTVDGLYVDQPAPFNVMRTGFTTISGSSSNGTYKNFGTYASPIDTGTATARDKAFSRSAAVATITSTAHGLRNNDMIMVMVSTDTTTSPISSAGTAIPIGVKTITVVDANTFTFTCSNAGAASGTIDYYGVGIVSNVFNTTAGSNTTYQNIHIRGNGAVPVKGSTVSDTVKHQNCTFDYRFYSTTPFNRIMQNETLTSCYTSSYEYFQTSSAIFGIHFMDYYVRPETTPGTDTVVSGVSWSRSGTLATVTSTAHGLQHNERIYVENALSGGSSAQAVIPNGVKELQVSVIDKNTFAITAVNTGATSGTLDYRLPGDGYMLVSPTEPSSATTSYVTVSGSAVFTGGGILYAPAVNDQVIWEMQDWMIGFDHMAKFPGYVYGSGVTSSQYDLYYDINTGSGYSGTYKNLAYNRGGASGSAAATTFTVTNATGVNVNDYVYGIGIAGGAKVTAVNTGTNTITVNTAHTGAVSGNIIFNYGPNESTFPSTGVKFKVKLVTNTTNTASIYNIHTGLVSTSTTRAYLYPQTTSVPIAVQVLDSTLTPIQNARVYIKAAAGGPLSTGTLIYTALTDASGNISTTFGYSSTQPITGWVRRASSGSFYKQGVIAGNIISTGYSSTVILVADS